VPGEDIVYREAFDCDTRVCIVDRFQGRVTCPLGQAAPVRCAGPGDTACPAGAECREAGSLAPPCSAGSACPDGLACNPETRRCECGRCPDDHDCDAESRTCKRFVCHTPGSCQQVDVSDAENEGKACCLPGTDDPVGDPVCGQCTDAEPERSVYCSCQCDGPHPCECPEGFECRAERWRADMGPHPMFCFRKRSDPSCLTVRGRGEPCELE